MKLFQLLSAISLTSILVSGCSGGGGQRVVGRQCPVDHGKTIDMKPAQKLWEKGQGNESIIPAGTYTYERADMIYTERGPKGLIIHVQDTRLRDGTFKASINCVRNGSAVTDKATISSTATVASKILAKANNAGTEVDVKELLFKVVDGRLTGDSKSLEKTDSLGKAYDGKAETVIMIESPNKVDYEIRSSFSDNNSDQVVSVKFKKTP